jgi:hypothetical protein
MNVPVDMRRLNGDKYQMTGRLQLVKRVFHEISSSPTRPEAEA